MKKNLIVVLSGAIVKHNGVWRTTRSGREGDGFGGLWCRFRVLAAKELYDRWKHQGCEVMVLATGGKGKLAHIPEIPFIGDVIAEELIDLGVDPAAIRRETESGSTFQQLRMVIDDLGYFGVIAVISNRYHLPRIEAMITHADALKPLRMPLARKQAKLIAAEDILIEGNSAEWSKQIADAYESPEMAARIANEENGLRDIQRGTYVFQ